MAAKSKDLASSGLGSKVKLSTSSKLFYILAYVSVGLMALICIIPFIVLISGSFTSENYIRTQGYSLFINEFSTKAYELIFRNPVTVFRAYGISILITGVGTILGTLLITMTAYVICRKDFKYRNHFSFFFYFTTLFNGGMVSTYIFYIQYLKLKDSLWALILPGLFNVFYLLIMRSFVNTIPPSLIEASKIDGAGVISRFIHITCPCIKRVFLVTLTLVGIWTFNSFNVIFVLTGGGPMRSTETLMLKIYEQAFSKFNLGAAYALSSVVVVILFIFTMLYYKLEVEED